MDFKVLIVDDDPMMLFLHKNLIMKSGVCMEPLTFLNGEEVLHYLLEEPKGSSFYIMLLDINMPVMNGWQLLEVLKELPIASQVDVAIVSSSVDKKDKDKAMEYSLVSCYFTKPFYNLEEVKKMKQRRLVEE